MFYPAQLNVYGGNSLPQISYQYDVETSSWKKHYNIYDHQGTLQQQYKYVYAPWNPPFNTVAEPTLMQAHYPFGETRWEMDDLDEENKSVLNWIGKQKDKENGLGDHGVRKYEYETGRFTSIDPLWNKYYGWTPYQYSMNSPVGYSDGNGYVVIKQNFTDVEDQGFEETVEFLSSIGSPTIDNILETVYGPDYNIYINSFSQDKKNVKTSTPSNVGRQKTLESEWKSHKDAEGMTLQPPGFKSKKADIILSTESLENITSYSKFNIFETAATSILDEFNHSISTNSEYNEHQNLRDNLQNELNSGVIKNRNSIRYINWFIERMNDQLKK